MKAIIYEKYGSPEVLQLKEVQKPVPNDNEILIKIHAVSINGSDTEGLIGKPLYARTSGLMKPGLQILGSDVAGHVEAVGKNITYFKPGDDVFGEIPGYHGGFAEYVCTHGKTMMLKPANMTFEEAAAIPQAGVIAFQGIWKIGQVQPGQYDLILDLIAHRSAFAYKRALKTNGACFFVGGSVAVLFQILLLGPVIRRTSGKNLRLLAVPQNREDLVSITELCQTGKVVPVIDKSYPFREVPAAFWYITQGQAKGKIVISLENDSKTA